MAIEQLKVKEIVKQAVGKNVDIPEFQREFVWDSEQVKKFAESLFRDYPVGSFLLWDSSEYQEAKTAQGSQASLWIVDGQQRTTALALLLGQKPYWWPDAQDWNKARDRYNVLANLLPEDGSDRLEFALPNPIRRNDPRWISLREILSTDKVENLTAIAQDVVSKTSKDQQEALAQFVKVHARLQQLWQIRERDIPIIKISHEVEDVAEIFARLNQAGTRIKEADVILALAAVRNPGWIRTEYLPFSTDLDDRGWDLDAGVFIRTMTGIGQGRARLIEVPKDFWKPNRLPTEWKRAKEAIAEVLRRLSEYGLLSSELLPSSNSLIPLCVLHSKWGSASNYQFSKAVYWFLLANRDGRYSGSAITSLNEDVKAIVDADSFGGALEGLLGRLQITEIGTDEFLKRYDRAGNRFLRMMLYLVLYWYEAKDWIDGTLIGYDKTGSPITTGFQPQWHHIYPRSVLKKSNVSPDNMHSLANLTVINERTNVNKLSGKEPSKYIQQFKISAELLTPHMIPENFVEAVKRGDSALTKQWAISNYGDFLEGRAQLLTDASNEYLARLWESS